MPRILLCEKVDGRSELVLKDVEAPQPGPGEVRYRVHAVGLNRADILYMRGVHFFPTKFPSRVCVEASGVVDAVGAGVTEFQIGDCVTALPVLDETFGVGGEFAITPADCLAPWPAGFSAAEACSIWMQYLTAYFPLKEMTPVGPGDAILVTAASGSAGLGGIQLAKLFGATVIATTRTERKRQFLLNAGADHVVVTERADVAAQILSCTQNKGVRVVYDAVAGRFINEYASALAQDAQIIVYGVMGGGSIECDILPLVRKSAVIRVYPLNCERLAVRRARLFISLALAAGALRPIVDRVFPLERALEAYAYLDSGSSEERLCSRPE